MTEVFLAVEAMQDEQVACQYFIPAGEDVWNFAGLRCSTLPWAQGLLAKDLTCFAVQRVSHGGRNMGALKWTSVTVQHSVSEEM